MPVIHYKKIKIREEAIELLQEEGYLEKLPLDFIEQFDYVINLYGKDKLREKSKEIILKELGKQNPRLGIKGWPDIGHYIGLPHIRFSREEVLFYFSIDLYLVTSVEAIVRWKEIIKNCIVIAPVKRGIDKFSIPPAFFKILSEEDFKNLEFANEDYGYTTLSIPSLNQKFRINNALLERWFEAFAGQPFEDILTNFGGISFPKRNYYASVGCPLNTITAI